VYAKVLGRRGPVLEPMEVSSALVSGTVRELLAQIVHHQVAAFTQRKNANRLLRILTANEVEDGIEAGKIISGGQEEDERIPDESVALENAITAFKDGLYFLFVNEVQIEDLEERVTEVREVLFVRLTALAGG
jgi:hypothetical protein